MTTDIQKIEAPAAPEETRTINRADYTPADWRCETVNLLFELGVEETRVHATLAMERQGGETDAPVRLDVDGALPDVLAVDGLPVQWTQVDGQIFVPVGHDMARVQIELTTTLHPDANSQLMGLYASNGMLCTQCEAEGFRRIIPFIDRPDNLAVYTVRMEGDKKAFPVLLSNGALEEAGDLADGRHYAVWHDPWPKPSYLFALVAGDLVANRDHFTTMSGKNVDLAIYVRAGDEDRTHHAMTALKNSMAWDERVYGREYDLPVFNIVAVSDFNMGAMENKGLNIFNTRYILADPDTATDADYDGVEAVVAHEYFHNWSGNRVTCRDWFQLSLKEGFTVYRDQSFSADMGSAAVKRIEDVRVLRAAQFPEDAGPLAHPIRPDSYQEISNFYTATVYNKGAEIIRMMATLLGPQGFRKGTDLYFDRHDGEAATCEDFVRAMEEGGAIDLGLFRRWYDQAGTPRVQASLARDATTGEASLILSQIVPPTPGQEVKEPMLLPLRTRLFDRGNEGAEGSPAEQLILLDSDSKTVPLGRITGAPALSINRGFSAPVIVEAARDAEELAWLAAHDDDPFSRYEALQQLMLDTIVARINGVEADSAPVIAAVRQSLAGATQDPAFAAEALILPSEAFIGDQLKQVAPEAIRANRLGLLGEIGRALESEWRHWHEATGTDAADLTPASKGKRRLRGVALSALTAAAVADAGALGWRQYKNASGMTDRQSALVALSHGDAPEREQAFADFYDRYHDNPLVLDKWYQLQVLAMRDDVPETVEKLAQHLSFTLSNPNRVRALYGAFAANQGSFHRADGKGYALLADLIAALDAKNPQTAARLVPPLGRWKRFDAGRQAMMKAALERVLATPGLSKDVHEQAAKSLKS